MAETGLMYILYLSNFCDILQIEHIALIHENKAKIFCNFSLVEIGLKIELNI